MVMVNATPIWPAWYVLMLVSTENIIFIKWLPILDVQTIYLCYLGMKIMFSFEKVVPIAVCNQWNQWSIGSSFVHSFNKDSDMMLASCGNSLPKKNNLASRKSFPTMQCHCDQPLCKALEWFSRMWLFLEEWSAVKYLTSTKWYDF